MSDKQNRLFCSHLQMPLLCCLYAAFWYIRLKGRSPEDMPAASNSGKGIGLCESSLRTNRSMHYICVWYVNLITWKCVHFVTAGCGKSHFIKQQMKKSSYSVIVAINEGFEPQKAIKRLYVLPKNERNCAIFFNFHLIPPVGVSLSVR